MGFCWFWGNLGLLDRKLVLVCWFFQFDISLILCNVLLVLIVWIYFCWIGNFLGLTYYALL